MGLIRMILNLLMEIGFALNVGWWLQNINAGTAAFMLMTVLIAIYQKI